MGFRWMVVMLLQCLASTMVSGLLNESVKFETKPNPGKVDAVKSIQSEDGDIIDCIDIYKQPAFDHPALKNHKIQMKPSHDIEMDTADTVKGKNTFARSETGVPVIAVKQLWQKNGTCPDGTVPIRRRQKISVTKEHKIRRKYGMQKAKIMNAGKEPKEQLMLHQPNRSLAIVIADGFAYYGIGGDIRVWNPEVEHDNDYSKSMIGLAGGTDSELQTGWIVHPSLYGDRQTRLFIYWTADNGKQTGCFDLYCSGFIQTSHVIALGAAIYPVSNPLNLPYALKLLIHLDRDTHNWWVRYDDKIELGYWPQELFETLKYHFIGAEWGGEVYSSWLGTHHPHTATQMGNGFPPDPYDGDSGHISRMRVIGNNFVPRIPEWVTPYTDEDWPWQCYSVVYRSDYAKDPDLYYGGMGRSDYCY